MRTLFGLIPFIAAPFCFPGVSASLRLAALLLLGIVCCAQLIRKGEDRSVSPFHLAVLAGIGVCYFSTADLWSHYTIWPILTSGILLTIAVANSPVSIPAGLCCTSAVLCALAVLNVNQSDLFPYERFQEIAARIYPKIPADALTQAIRSPALQSIPIVLQSLLTVTTAVLFSLAFRPSGKFILNAARYGALIGCCLVLFLFFGRHAYLAVGLNVLLFFALTGQPETLTPGKRIGVMMVLLALCAAGFMGWFDSPTVLAHQRMSAWVNVHPLLDITETIGTSPAETPVPGHDSPCGDPIVTAVILIGLLLLVVENARARVRKNPIFPAGLSILIQCVYWAWPAPLAALAHPIAWLSAAGIQNARRSGSEPDEDRTPGRSFQTLPSIIGAIAVLLTSLAAFDLYSEWRAETHIQRFGLTADLTEQYQIAQAAFRQTPYRGDTASIYAAASVRILLEHQAVPLEHQAVPTDAEQKELDYAIGISAKYGYAPLQAIVDLSNLYLNQLDPEPSIQVLETAVSWYPDEFLLHESLADKLDDAGRKEEAIERYRICVNLDPSSQRIRRNLAILYQTLGRRAEAEREWNHFMTLDPTAEKPRIQ